MSFTDLFGLTFLHSKQNKIRSLKLVGFIVEGLMPIGSEEDPEDVDEDSPSRVCCSSIKCRI